MLSQVIFHHLRDRLSKMVVLHLFVPVVACCSSIRTSLTLLWNTSPGWRQSGTEICILHFLSYWSQVSDGGETPEQQKPEPTTANKLLLISWQKFIINILDAPGCGCQGNCWHHVITCESSILPLFSCSSRGCSATSARATPPKPMLNSFFIHTRECRRLKTTS